MLSADGFIVLVKDILYNDVFAVYNVVQGIKIVSIFSYMIFLNIIHDLSAAILNFFDMFC